MNKSLWEELKNVTEITNEQITLLQGIILPFKQHQVILRPRTDHLWYEGNLALRESFGLSAKNILSLSLRQYLEKLQTSGGYGDSGDNMRLGFKNFNPLDDLLCASYGKLPISPQGEMEIHEIIYHIVEQECENTFDSVRNTLGGVWTDVCVERTITGLSVSVQFLMLHLLCGEFVKAKKIGRWTKFFLDGNWPAFWFSDAQSFFFFVA